MFVVKFTRLVRLGAFVLFCFAVAIANAQVERRFTAEMGGGFTPPVGQLSNRFDAGWNMAVGGGVNLTKNFSVQARYMYNGFGVNSGVLALAGAPDGNARVWSITADPRVQFAFGSHFSPYIVGGVGYYRRTVDFTQPMLARAAFFDPFFGAFIPGLVGTNQLLSSVHRSGVGGSLGGGFSFGIGQSGMKLFTEARYHYANTGSIPTRMVPLTVGIRF